VSEHEKDRHTPCQAGVGCAEIFFKMKILYSIQFIEGKAKNKKASSSTSWVPAKIHLNLLFTRLIPNEFMELSNYFKLLPNRLQHPFVSFNSTGKKHI